jgi:hypothetical protein
MTEQLELSEEEWAHERHHMAQAGFDDLYHVTLGHDQDGKPYLDAADTIRTAFGLVADGMSLPADSLARNVDEFLKAADAADPQRRADAMRVALENLSSVFGFKIGP